ncbi:MAG: thioredoxin family protein [bacterium]
MSLAIGDPAPAFSLPGVDGRDWSLADFADKTVLVVIFSCNHCPYVQAYEDRIMAIQRDFGAQGAQVVAINSNETVHHPEDRFDLMVERSKMKGFNFPYLRDESQAVAHAYDAERTPQIFCFDNDRQLAYTGAIDDNYKEPSAATRNYLRGAITSLLAGQPVAEATTYAIGCSVKWNV